MCDIIILYLGSVILKQPTMDNWIRKHGSFASRDWLEGQVRYGYWIHRRNNSYELLVDVVEGGKRRTRVLIRFLHYPNGNINYPYNHVFIYHAHCF